MSCTKITLGKLLTVLIFTYGWDVYLSVDFFFLSGKRNVWKDSKPWQSMKYLNAYISKVLSCCEMSSLLRIEMAGFK